MTAEAPPTTGPTALRRPVSSAIDHRRGSVAGDSRRSSERTGFDLSTSNESPVAVEIRPRFSIVVPAFNEAEYLPATLQSLCSQHSRAGAEIVVVDNNSDDATAEVARAFGVRVVDETEPGVCRARQRGFLEACGEIVISVDADTIYPPGWLARIETTFDQRPDAVAVAGPCRYVDPPWWMAGFSRGLFAAVYRIYSVTGWVGYVTATNTAFRRDQFDGYDMNLTQGGDELDLLRRLRSRGRIVWDSSNSVATSSRRQMRGLVHTLVISFLIYYLLAYGLNRVASRTVLGRAPVVRGRLSVASHGRT